MAVEAALEFAAGRQPHEDAADVGRRRRRRRFGRDATAGVGLAARQPSLAARRRLARRLLAPLLLLRQLRLPPLLLRLQPHRSITLMSSTRS